MPVENVRLTQLKTRLAQLGGITARAAQQGAHAGQRGFYRVRQFTRGLRAHVTAADMAQVAHWLPAAALPLFTAMPLDAQRHSLNVLHTLASGDKINADLAAAALLHDCGKVAAAEGGMPLGLWQRGPVVILDRVVPRLTYRWETNTPTQGWRYLLFVQHHHPEIGARWAAAAGCSELTCWLIAHHEIPPEQLVAPQIALELLAALEDADALN
jgi:hypothetical protein